MRFASFRDRLTVTDTEVGKMGTFGEQLSAARKEANLTQDQLADRVHVTRAAVSHWENGRYIPDFDMIRKLSEVLNVRFDMDASEAAPEKPDETPATDMPEAPETGTVPADTDTLPMKKGKKTVLWIAAALAVAAVALALVLLLRPSGGERESVPGTDQETRYSISDYKALAQRETGKAYVMIDTESRVEHAEGTDYWMYTFRLREDNGVSFRIDEIETVNFFEDRAHPRHFTPDELALAGIGPDLEAGITYPFVGGCPLDQHGMKGVGIKVLGTDENGEKLSFTAYVPFPEQ